MSYRGSMSTGSAEVGLAQAFVCSLIYLVLLGASFAARPNYHGAGYYKIVEQHEPMAYCPMSWWVHLIVVLTSLIWAPILCMLIIWFLIALTNLAELLGRTFNNGYYARFCDFIRSCWPSKW